MVMSDKALLILSQVYVPDPASVGQHMHDAATEMVRRGHSVRVIASARGYDDPGRRYPLREERDGVSIRRIPFGSLGKKSIVVRLLGQLSFLIQAFVCGLFTRRIGAVFVSTSPPMCSAVALAISVLRRVPIVYWVMDINPDQVVRMGVMSEQALPVRAMEWLNRQILRRAHTVVTLDRFMAETLRRKADLDGRLAVFPPWAPAGSEPVAHEDNPFRRKHGLEGKFVLMHSGNHSPSHPLDTFLQAAEQLRERDDIVFMFVGGGCGKKVVDAAIEEGATNVVSLPYQPKEQLKNSLSAADVHLVSMGSEMVGVVHPCKVYGAMAVARPVLVLGPAECHATELVSFAQYGRHVEHGDAGRMTRVIREMAAVPEGLRASMGQQAASVLAAHYGEGRLNGMLACIVEAAVENREPALAEPREGMALPATERRAA
jgi:putative colanic acid biosynthesis glycosyltransferase WcaI